jgi:hypothetical protein
VFGATGVEWGAARNANEVTADVFGDRQRALTYSTEHCALSKIAGPPTHHVVRFRFLMAHITRVIPFATFELNGDDIENRVVMNASSLSIHEMAVNLR